MKENIIQNKSYAFALEIIKMYKFLVDQKHEFILSKQILRSDTAIGAIIEEAIGAQSKNDFISKMSMAYKEARETHYWLRLLVEGDYLKQNESEIIMQDCESIMKIIGKIQKTSKATLHG